MTKSYSQEKSTVDFSKFFLKLTSKVTCTIGSIYRYVATIFNY